MKWDYIIMVPALMETSEFIDNGSCCQSDAFIDKMNDILKYEVVNDIYVKTNRYFLGECELKFYKNWPEYHTEELPVIKSRIYLSLEKNSGICLFELVSNPEDDTYITYYLDAIPKDDIFIKTENLDDFIKMNEFVKTIGFSQITTPKNCVYLSERPSERVLTYILASEFYMEDDEAFIDSKILNEKLKTDVSQYDFLECYATPQCAVNIMRFFPENYSERLYYEGMSAFLVELVLFQIAAVYRTNNKIVSLLSNGQIPSLDVIKEISLQYAQTIAFRNINIFRSTTAQLAANEMYKAFEAPEIIEQYEQNQKMMEHIILLRDQIEESKHTQQQDEENNILGVLAAFSILSALCDGFSVVDFSLSLEEIVSRFFELGVMDFISIILKLGLVVCIIKLSLPSLAIIRKNSRKKRNE